MVTLEHVLIAVGIFVGLLFVWGLIKRAMRGSKAWIFDETGGNQGLKQLTRTVVLGAAFTAFVWLIAGELFFQRKAVTSTGTVTSVSAIGKERPPFRSKRYRVTYSFVTADGQTIVGKDTVRAEPYQDALLTVYYDPANPDNNQGEKRSLWLYGFLALASGWGLWQYGGGRRLMAGIGSGGDATKPNPAT